MEGILAPPPGHGTEYTENFKWSHRHNTGGVGSWTPSSPNGGSSQQNTASGHTMLNAASMKPIGLDRDPAHFPSGFYPSVCRETIIRRDEKGHYIDPYKNIASKPYGRRLQYDPDHPDKMFALQWSSELADLPGPYSFPTTTGLDPEIPWTKDMQWQAEGEVGEWPTPLWKTWTGVASCPPYDGHDDQLEYSQYKVQVYNK